MAKEDINQDDIDRKAQEVYSLFQGRNSAFLVFSLLSVIESVALNDNATAAFRKQTADLLNDQSFRISSSLRISDIS